MTVNFSIPSTTGDEAGASSGFLAEVRGLSIAFPDSSGGLRQVVNDVSFAVRPGEVLGIVGESGSGKSVSVRALVGLSGPGAIIRADALHLEGEDLAKLGAKDWRSIRGRRVGLVLQDGPESVFTIPAD